MSGCLKPKPCGFELRRHFAQRHRYAAITGLDDVSAGRRQHHDDEDKNSHAD